MGMGFPSAWPGGCFWGEGVKERGRRRALCLVHWLVKGCGRQEQFWLWACSREEGGEQLFLVKFPHPMLGEDVWPHLLFDPPHVPKRGSYE